MKRQGGRPAERNQQNGAGSNSEAWGQPSTKLKQKVNFDFGNGEKIQTGDSEDEKGLGLKASRSREKKMNRLRKEFQKQIKNSELGANGNEQKPGAKQNLRRAKTSCDQRSQNKKDVQQDRKKNKRRPGVARARGKRNHAQI